MDDKKLDDIVRKVEASMDAIEKSIKEMADCMQTLRSNAETELRERIEHLRQLTAPPKFTSGRWTRRDGDGFGMVPKPSPPTPNNPHNGDGQTGDL